MRTADLHAILDQLEGGAMRSTVSGIGAAAIAVLGFVLLSGCAAGTPEAAPEPTEAAADSGTVAQWASVVAEVQASFDDWYAPWDEAHCGVSSTMTCGIQTLSGSFVGQTVSIKLETAQTSTALSGYIADDPPAEIADLWSETRAAADEFAAAGKTWSDTCNAAPDTAGCDTLLFKLSSDADGLNTQFAAWKPYL